MLSFLRRLSLVRKLALFVFLIDIAVFAVLTLYVSQRTYTNIAEQAQLDLIHELDLLTATFEVFDRTITQNTVALENVFLSMFPQPLHLDQDNKMQVGQYQAPVLKQGEEVLNLRFEKPDAFTRITGGNATVFVRYGDDFLRVSTSLRKENGERAVGTLLGKSHPGYRLLLDGKPYLGKARLFGRDYMTQYKPVQGPDGEVIAVLYVGFDFTETFAGLQQTLKGLVIGKTGHVWLAHAGGGERGHLLTAEGKMPGNLLEILDADGKPAFAQAFEQPQGILHYGIGDAAGARHEEIAAFRRLKDWGLIIGINAAVSELTGLSARLSAELAGVTLIAALVMVLVLFLVMRRELAPLAQVSQRLARIGKGDLSTDPGQCSSLGADRDTRNEIALLCASVDDMVGQFRGLISGMHDTTQVLNASADELASLTEHTRHDLSDQQDRTDHVATAVTEMSASIQEVARNVATAADSTRDANHQAASGRSTVSEVEHAIKSVAEQVEGAAQVINNLKRESVNIGTVLDVIRGIAEQTNLLALNAAIEAARAGEQGRGFAVVADEVRSLAQRTQQSTQEIRKMIERLQAEASTAVSHMETSRDHGRSSVEKSLAAGAALAAIATSAAKVSDMITQVATATEEQSAVSEEISGNVVGIRDLSDHTAQRANQIAESSERLAQLAQQLRHSVGRFHL